MYILLYLYSRPIWRTRPLSHRPLTNFLSCRISFLLEFQKLQSDSESKMHGGIPLGFGMYNRGSQTENTLLQFFQNCLNFAKLTFQLEYSSARLWSQLLSWMPRFLANSFLGLKVFSSQILKSLVYLLKLHWFLHEKYILFTQNWI